MHERLAIGCMSGTSLDGLDVALVRARGRGLEIAVELVEARSFPFGELGPELLACARGAALTAASFASLARRFGELHATAIQAVAAGRLIELVCVHGQTVTHAPPDSLQLLNPWPIAQRVGVPVLFDLRGADLAAGGEGAPITPLADVVLLRSAQHSRAIVNLGGFANATLLPRASSAAAALEEVRGADLVPCNHWLDGLARARLGRPFDADGAVALTGEAQPEVVQRFLGLLEHIHAHARSLGSAHEQPDLASLTVGASAADALASAAAAIAHAIARGVQGSDEVLLAGGSVHNRALVRAIERACDATVASSATAGVDPSWREAMAMAVLGLLSRDGLPITLPSVTGVGRAPRAGAWCHPPLRSES